jgi:dynein heavy chain, axonemal
LNAALSSVWFGRLVAQEQRDRKDNSASHLFLENIIASVHCIESEFAAVWNQLQVRQWEKPTFLSGSVKGTFIYPMPFKNNFSECVYIPEDSKWKTWLELLPNFKIPPATPYSSIVVPNSYTAQMSNLLELLLSEQRHVLICGPTGTAQGRQSLYINNTITSALPQDKFKPLQLGFSAKTSANGI